MSKGGEEGKRKGIGCGIWRSGMVKTVGRREKEIEVGRKIKWK